MKFLVVGNGRLGTAVHKALTTAEHEVLTVSRSSGIDVTLPVSFDQYAGFDGVVEATDIFTRNRSQAIDFFTTSTQHIKEAAHRAGIQRHVLVSIVNCEHPSLDRVGYYAGKAAQERAALGTEGPATTIVRSTLWYEFARQNQERLRVGPLGLVPRITSKPIALAAVADAVASSASAVAFPAEPQRHDLCGPEVMTLWQMTKALPHRRGILIPVPAGTAVQDGTLVPTQADVVGPTFAEWCTSTARL